jgi:hypothetical protein
MDDFIRFCDRLSPPHAHLHAKIPYSKRLTITFRVSGAVIVSSDAIGDADCYLHLDAFRWGQFIKMLNGMLPEMRITIFELFCMSVDIDSVEAEIEKTVTKLQLPETATVVNSTLRPHLFTTDYVTNYMICREVTIKDILDFEPWPTLEDLRFKHSPSEKITLTWDEFMHLINIYGTAFLTKSSFGKPWHESEVACYPNF